MNEVYRDQFTPADISEAKELVRFALQHNIVLDVLDYNDDFIADLLIVKCMELAKYETK